MSQDNNAALPRAEVFQAKALAGYLYQKQDGSWAFQYTETFGGIPISLTLPIQAEPYIFKEFPAVFDGLLPEGTQLEALLNTLKIDRKDYFRQLITVGRDLVGSLSVKRAKAVNTEEVE